MFILKPETNSHKLQDIDELVDETLQSTQELDDENAPGNGSPIQIYDNAGFEEKKQSD